MRVDASTETEPVLRVAAIAASIQQKLRGLPGGWVEGEVQDMSRPGSGHVYFTLADREARIGCIVWRSRAGRIVNWPENGRLIQAHFDRVDFYRANGRVSLHVDALRLTGEGELLARRAATLARLKAEGLTARARRPLPRFPRRVGVIAARRGDATVDVVKALKERWPVVQVVHRAALMEGVAAVNSLIDALAQLQEAPAVDVIVIARGGGGVAELMAFDDERLCRAIFASPVPVVTSIAHTPQRPNCDHVAAAYADVPARAAELVVPSARELSQSIARASDALAVIPAHLEMMAGMVTNESARARPWKTLERRVLEMESLDGRLVEHTTRRHTREAHAVESARHALARTRVAVPAPGMLDLPAQRLAAASGRFLTIWGAQLDAAGRSLSAARQLPAIEGLGRLATLLAPAARRARDQAARYASAITRRGEESTRSITVRLEEQARDLDGMDVAMTREVRAETQRRQVQFEHALELIWARDFRRSGWVLAGDPAGNPIRSVRQLAPGDPLLLAFHDGRAVSAVTSVEPEEAENG